MQNYKLYSTGKIIHLELTVSKKEYSFIFVFNDKDQANVFKTDLEKSLNNLKSLANLEDIISGLKYDALINHKDLEVMGAANDKLPGFYKSALEDNVSKIYLGVSLS